MNGEILKVGAEMKSEMREWKTLHFLDTSVDLVRKKYLDRAGKYRSPRRLTTTFDIRARQVVRRVFENSSDEESQGRGASSRARARELKTHQNVKPRTRDYYYLILFIAQAHAVTVVHTSVTYEKKTIPAVKKFERFICSPKYVELYIFLVNQSN